ncbi:retinol dehydrogenase 12-like [Anastrepha obliqua]|uniref:retinol dehydrogenase 12-like n=1 Tax=Anastrepha obliqua TaxID=95512 RepID=UPI00240A7065|nr:retinol dehydrogenase 12-like [Anastrepha obliqua]
MSDEVLSPLGDEEKSLCFRGPWAWLVLVVICCIGAGLVMWLLRKCVQGPFYRKKTRIDGKVVIVTGCNTGIGKETAMELARRGGRIYMACRDAARCETARLEIIERTQNQNVFNRTLDLSSLPSVRQFAERFFAEEQRLDILINNAGIMSTPRKLTVDGFEQQFGVNHLGHFLLTNLLLDRLKSAAPSRIVVVSSAAYIFGRINKDDLNSENNYSKFLGAYCQSKLANILFTRKLAELLKNTGVTVNCVHPGIVRTELGRYSVSKHWFQAFSFRLFGCFVKTPKAGAQTTLRLALDPALEKCTGDYYADLMRFPLLSKAKDKEMADWLWKESEKLVGLQGENVVQTIVVNQ